MMSIHNVLYASLLIICRNEELQEQLWAMSMRDVRERLSLETRERFGEPGQSLLPPDDTGIMRTRRHSFRSSLRVKPEDRERLIDTEGSTRSNKGWGTEEEEEGE